MNREDMVDFKTLRIYSACKMTMGVPYEGLSFFREAPNSNSFSEWLGSRVTG